MNFEISIYMIGYWFLFTTVLFIFVLLWINKLEIRSSRKHLSIKLILHYGSIFNKIKRTFYKYESSVGVIYDLDEQPIEEVISNITEKKEPSEIAENEISKLLLEHCSENQFLFILNNKLRESIVLLNKELIEKFNEWIVDKEKITIFTKEYDVLNSLDDDNTLKEHIGEDVTLNQYFSGLSINIKETLNDNHLKYLKMIDIITNIHILISNDSYGDIFILKKRL